MRLKPITARSGELRDSLDQIGFGHDRVALVDVFGLVIGELHCKGAGDSGSLEVADPRASQVVEELVARSVFMREPEYSEENFFASVFDMRKAERVLDWSPRFWREFGEMGD